jgi:RHS repeat-associated protein
VVWFGGTRSGSVSTDIKFTGQRLDQTGLYYYGARYYDPEIKRFISADTIVPDPVNSQAFNRYAYCINNPLKYIDPSGHGWWSIITDIASIAFDVYQVATDPSWENAGYLALDVTLTCLPIIPAGAGPLAKGVTKTIKFMGKGEKVVEGVDKVVEGAKVADTAVRKAYQTEVRGLADLEQQLRAEGRSTEEIARTLHQARRDIGIKYKDLTSPEALKGIYERNLEKYGDKLGPSIDWLKEKGKSWEDIIESAKKEGDEFNIRAGIQE